AKAKTNKPGAGARMTKAPPQARPAEDARALRFAREAQVEAQRLRAQRARAAQDEAARAAAERAAAVKALAAERAAKQKAARARFAAEAQAARERRAAAARAESERRAEIAREAAERQALAEAERRRLAAEARASRARKRAELSSALATMANPDEELNASPASPAPSGRGSARKGRPAPGAAPAGEGSDEPLGARTAAAAALAESIDPGDAPGGGGGELLATSARGGGAGPEGGGVSWALEGSVGSRRLLSRVAPVSPDWVATRNLDLTVIVRFQVLPDGSVKSGAVIQKTSGFSDIDRRALESLRRWRFQPAKSGSEEWGRVSFRFTST
ncbi:MAG: TonB family protein, partial [Elusimicrobia bacterium]|nr:TonB family protein [Elusimicrobiota bacterium]